MFGTLAYYTIRFHRQFTSYTSERLQELGLSFGSLFPVIYVGKHPGCTQAQLTAALGMDWGYSQRCITRLVEDGFLTRTKEGRAFHLELSDKGQEAFQVSHQVFFDWDQEVLSALSQPEQEQLFALLAKIQKKEGGTSSANP